MDPDRERQSKRPKLEHTHLTLKGYFSSSPCTQSVPHNVRAVDLTSVAQRSPIKTPVQVKRAVSVPASDDDRMDVDAALLHYTNPVYPCAVNFATPSRPTTPTHLRSLSESPLTPLVSTPSISPSSECFPEMKSLLAKGSPTIRSSSRPSSIASTAASLLNAAPQSLLSRRFLSSSDLSELTPPSGEESSLRNTRNFSQTQALSSRPDSNMLPNARPTTIGSLKSKQGPSPLRGPRRVTRSVSVKEHRVKSDTAEIEHSNVIIRESSVTTAIPTAASSTLLSTLPPPSTMAPSKPPPKSTSSKLQPVSHKSTSILKPPPDPSKLKQASLNAFITKPSGKGDSIARPAASTSNSVSPSKIPIPASPSKRPTATQPENAKSFFLSFGSASTSVGTGTPRATSGRSLSTLSHALDKLVVPPPSRPNTSLGFVRAEGSSEEGSSRLDGKGKAKAKDDASLHTPRGSGTFARPTASSLNRAATVTTKMRGRGGATVGGMGARRAIGIFDKTGDRASRKPNLPVVAGSPVKGSSSTGDSNRVGWGAGEHKSRSSFKGAGIAGVQDDIFAPQSAKTDNRREQDMVLQDAEALTTGEANITFQKPQPLPPMAIGASNSTVIDSTTSMLADKGKQRAPPCSTLNPASSALHALSESLSTLPHTPTPPKPRAVGTRTGLRSSSAAMGKEDPALDGSGSMDSCAISEVHGSSGAGPSNGTADGSGGVKTSSLKILKKCAIFVDVRTEQGDDAGCLFVDMLKGLGAKIMGRLGRKCTHIVYKNGLPNTLSRYRMLNEPKPVVVGIAWVVECVEKRAKVDEERFKIDVEVINVAGGNKRRRSMLPKYLIPTSPGPDCEMSMHVSSEADDDEIDGSPSQDADASFRSRDEDDLPPLERARKRRSLLLGGQTRLVPY